MAPARSGHTLFFPLGKRPPGARRGWKLCETGHALPVISRLFPEARFLHLIRDVTRVGKWRVEDPDDLVDVCDLIGPTLSAFGHSPDA